jgi:uncharacterized Fe-S cluster protein YjdI
MGADMRDVVKRDTREDVTVVWQPGLCMHSRVCFHGLPAVFDPRRRPWIDMEGAELATIVEQVKRCRSGSCTLCRCGQSSNKPYCDGTHRKVGFEA